MLAAAVAEARAQLKVADRDADDLPTTEHRTDGHPAVDPPPVEQPPDRVPDPEPTLPDGRVNLAGLHRAQRFGADTPAPVTAPARAGG